jgi:hypothetical protein
MTSGGSLDSTGATALIAFALILGCFFASRLIAAMVRNRPTSTLIYGDVVEVPDAAKFAGGGAQRSARLAQNSGDIARHRDGAL